MYEKAFALQRRPFAATPSTEMFFPAESVEATRQTLVRCIERAEGAALVIGPSGTGKTLLCQLLAEQFRESCHVVHLSSGGLSTRRAFFQAILYHLGQPYRGMDEGELRLALADFLGSSKCRPQGMLLLVDEAHTLPLRLLDEIRMLMNLTVAGQARIRVLLAGGPVLEERLASPKLASLSQRLAARRYLEPLGRDETERYIWRHVEKCGGDGGRLFPSDVCAAVHQATDGAPRLINQVCDHALVLALTAGRRAIDRALVEEAWADLQQLPAPWSADRREADASVIEFGDLAETREPSATAAEAEPPTMPAPAAERRLEQIEAMLGGLDDEFQPAGSIGPEIELVFADPENPFAERFAEEEVVVDRYAALESRRQAPVARGQRPESDPTNGAETTPSEPAETPEDELPEIVVENETDGLSWHCRKPIATVRRHEYRQLFANLRRGR